MAVGTHSCHPSLLELQDPLDLAQLGVRLLQRRGALDEHVAVAAAAAAATPAKAKQPAKVKPVLNPKPVTTKVSCQLTLVLQPTAKVTTIVPGTGSGSQAGTAKCPGPVGGGLQTDTFTTDDGGDVTAPYTQWFKGGTLAGQYSLIPTGARCAVSLAGRRGQSRWPRPYAVLNARRRNIVERRV